MKEGTTYNYHHAKLQNETEFGPLILSKMVGEVDETKENLDLSDSESEHNYKVKENLCFSDSGGEDEVKENLGFSDSEDEVKENLDLTDLCDMYKMKISKLEALVEELKVQLNEKVVIIDEEDDEVINKNGALIEFNEYHFEAYGNYEQMKNLVKNIGWDRDGKRYQLKKHHLDIFKYIKSGQLDKLKEVHLKHGSVLPGYTYIPGTLARKYDHQDIITYLKYNCS